MTMIFRKFVNVFERPDINILRKLMVPTIISNQVITKRKKIENNETIAVSFPVFFFSITSNIFSVKEQYLKIEADVW